MSIPPDAQARRSAKPVICYPTDTLPQPDMALYQTARATARLADEIRVPPREARVIRVPAGQVLRIESTDGPQVGDLNLFNPANLSERFFSGKTRALHPCQHRRQALVLSALSAPHGHNHQRQSGLVRD